MGYIMTITLDGAVGITTASADAAVILIDSTGSDSTDDARLELKTTNGIFTIQNDKSLGASGALTFAGNVSDNLVIDHATGNVGIGKNTPGRSLDIASAGATIGIENTSVGGGSISIDAPVSGLAQIDVVGANDLRINTNSAERMRIDSGGLITQVNATSGRGAIVGEQTFRLASNGSALGPTIADFFGATSSISLEASSVYQITAYCVFTKTTAGTITWTMTASSAPTRMTGTYNGSPVTGIAAGALISGFAGSQGATTAAFAATGSLTTAVNHAFQINIQVQTNAATSWELQITNSAGTATPLAGSYYTVKKISASTGAFV